MNEVIASNIRRVREKRSWTQRQLDEAARVDERTVQRAEEGRGVSAETLQAISGALDVSLEDLRKDAAEEQVKAAVERRFIPLDVIEHSATFQTLLGSADALQFGCVVLDDDIQDRAADLKQLLREWLDVWSDTPEPGRRDAAKELYGVVTEFGERGLVVTAGLDAMRLTARTGGPPIDMKMLSVIVSPKSDPRRFAMLDKRAPIDFDV